MAIRRMFQRRGTSEQWSAANPVLGDGEIGWDRSGKRFKVGDGLTAWNSLPWGAVDESTLAGTYAPLSGAGSPAAALASAQTYTDGESAARATGDANTLTTATGRAIAFAIALG